MGKYDEEFKDINLDPMHLITSGKKDDFALLLVPAKEISKVIKRLPEVRISKDTKESKEFNSNGYPNDLNGSALLFNLERRGKGINKFMVKTDLPVANRRRDLASETVGGYSGSGVFKKETNQLVGIITELVNPDGWPDFVYCQKMPNTRKLIEEHAGKLKEIIEQEEEIIVNGEEEEKDWETAQKIDTIFSYQKYLKRYPEGQYVDTAKGIVEELDCWFDTLKNGKQKAFNRYERDYPEGRFNKQDFEDRLYI